MPQDFAAIPQELRDRMQWVCWRYETKEEGTKPTKVPYNPATGQKAASNDRATWVTYNMAVGAANANIGYDGIGFVLSKDDPYAVIDLDDASEEPEVHARQVKIYEAFADTYAEISPSGKGLHIICKGYVPSGRKRLLCEIYSDVRFITMTGNVYRYAPITDHHNLANLLWSELGTAAVVSYYDGSSESTSSDEEIFSQASRAANARKFVDLYQGHWQAEYPSQSEADLALINIISFYSRSREQIKRIFRSSALGKREKAQSDKGRIRGVSYTDWMITRSFDLMLPPVNIDALKDRMNAHMQAQSVPIANGNGNGHHHYETLAAEPISTREAILPLKLDEYPLTPPPGLVGDIARFIYRRAPRPVPEIAMVGAIGLMSGICGQAYNISGTGLNNYMMLIAKTAVGKEAIATGITALMTSVADIVPGAAEFIGPSQIASPEALLRHLSESQKSFVSIFGEMGQRLLQMASPNANPSVIGLKAAWLDLYNKSGKHGVVRKQIYADSRKNTSDVKGAAFSMIGESVPKKFYEALSEDSVEEGLVSRFTVIEYHGDRPPLVEGVELIKPDPELRQRFAELCTYALRLNQADEVIDVQYTPEAQKMMRQFGVDTDARINATEDVTRELYNRAHMKAMRMAALIAVGNNFTHPVIDVEAAEWAIRLVVNDVRNMSDRFDRGEIGNLATSESAQLTKVRVMIMQYLHEDGAEIADRYQLDIKMHAAHVIPYVWLQRRLSTLPAFRNDRMGAGGALKRAIQALLDNGEIVEVSKQQMLADFASSARAFGVVDFSQMQQLDSTKRARVHSGR